eukprot:6172874-Pleurochrysis_carterae.AAC.1
MSNAPGPVDYKVRRDCVCAVVCGHLDGWPQHHQHPDGNCVQRRVGRPETAATLSGSLLQTTENTDGSYLDSEAFSQPCFMSL